VSPEVLSDVAMATNFFDTICYNCFLALDNFGCMIGSDTLFDSRGGFSG